MNPIVLLGPQHPVPSAGAALAALGVHGRVATVTAGWQEREGELDALREDVPNPLEDLAVYARCEEAFGADPGLFAAHRERQNQLIALQRFYRIRLAHALAAARELADVQGASTALGSARRASVTALRSLDRLHLRHIRRAHESFMEHHPREGCRALAEQRDALRATLGGCEAILIAGGHIAVLIGRLRLLGFADLVADLPIVAWSAGAMALTEQIVLFHDHPPQGAGDPEVFDAGLGFVRGIVALPSASERLALDDPKRVALFARRFAPARAFTLDAGASIRVSASGLLHCATTRQLDESGRLIEATGE